MIHLLTILPDALQIPVTHGTNLLQALRDIGAAPNAPCGGAGTCGKCTVLIDGVSRRACAVTVDRSMTVTVPKVAELQVLTASSVSAPSAPHPEGYTLAFDIGTTTVAGSLLSPDGAVLGTSSARNPQASYGADVVSRIRAALAGHTEHMTAMIRDCLNQMITTLCSQARILPESIELVSVVGNPAMQQLFLGIPLTNLAAPPFAPVLTQIKTINAQPYFPCLPQAKLLIVPNISGFVGADTLGCMLAVEMDKTEEITLLVDIGTNGEMVLGHRHQLIACSTAAGPALEGAQIQFGMSAQPGAIDRVRHENGAPCCHVIGEGKAQGICGSGLIDAVSAALDIGLLNNRGKILSESGQIPLTNHIFLTQEDIRQVQLAKGAIAAGIILLTGRMGISLGAISRVYLAGAFGTYLDSKAACRIGLLPGELDGKIEAVGNAALAGAALLTQDTHILKRVQSAADRTEVLDLSTAPDFPRTFAKCMRFITER